MTSYLAWCKSNSVYAKHARGLAQSLETKGFQVGVQKKQKDGRNIRGVFGLSIHSLVADSGCITPTGQNSNYTLPKGDLLENAATSAIRYQIDTHNQDADSLLLIKMRTLYEQVRHYRTKTGSIFWYGGQSGYASDCVDPAEYARRVKECAHSNDPI